VRITTYKSFAGSIHSDVPVNPVWPIALADILEPHDEVGSIVSQPSARELRARRLAENNASDGDLHPPTR
jgi:hypothetical protein